MNCLSQRLLPFLALAVTLAVPAASVRAADVPFAGNWKLSVSQGPQMLSVAIVKVEDKDGKPTASLVTSKPVFPTGTLEDARIDAKSIRFSLKANGRTFVVTGYPAKGAKPKKLYTTFNFGPTLLGTLESTTDTTIDEKMASTPDAGAQALAKVARSTPDEKEKAIKEVLKDHGDEPVAVEAARQLLTLKADNKESTEADLKTAADQYLKIGANYGPEYELQTAVAASRALLKSEKGTALAVTLAQKAEKQMGKDDSLATVASVLKVLGTALRKAGKADDAKTVDARLAKVEDQLDADFLKTNMPFTPEKFAGRKDKSQRVVVCELFTGAQCPPCVSADIAFDGALKSYKDTEVVFLQYHLHIPGPDALTNADSEGRQKFYGDQIRGTPTMFIDGKVTPGMGGLQQHAKERYEALTKLLNEALEKDAKADLKLNLTRAGDKIDIKAQVAGLKNPGEKVRLRLVLIEDVARYVGGNGQRLHHHVVRAFPGGLDGLALEKETATQNVTINLADLRKSLNKYLDEYKNQFSGQMPFKDDAERPMDLKELKVVALIQNDETKEILQAAQVGVPEAK